MKLMPKLLMYVEMRRAGVRRGPPTAHVGVGAVEQPVPLEALLPSAPAPSRVLLLRSEARNAGPDPGRVVGRAQAPVTLVPQQLVKY